MWEPLPAAELPAKRPVANSANSTVAAAVIRNRMQQDMSDMPFPADPAAAIMVLTGERSATVTVGSGWVDMFAFVETDMFMDMFVDTDMFADMAGIAIMVGPAGPITIGAEPPPS